MSYRTLAARLLGRGAVAAVSVAGAALLLAPAGYAAQFFPTDGPSLAADISTANSTGGFNQIVLANTAYVLPSAVTITGNLEITGNPAYQATTAAPGPIIDGSSVPTTQDAITIGAGANVILKALEVNGAGFNSTQPTAAVHVLANTPPTTGGGNLELDNMTFENSQGNGLVVDPGATATLNNSSILDTLVNAVVLSPQNGNVPTLNLNSSTIYHTTGFGIVNTDTNDNINVNNSIIGQSNGGGTSAKDCENPLSSPIALAVDDTSCTGTASAAFILFGNAYNHGPTLTRKPRSGPVVSGGNAATCQLDDQTFWLRGSSCSIGAVQATTTQDTSTTPPACTASAPNYGVTPATQTAHIAAQSGIGLGPDTVLGTTIDVAGTSNPETGATASWATVPGTLFDETSPGAPNPPGTLLDEPSTSPFSVTATKSSGTHAVNDTQWSIVAQDWLGNVTDTGGDATTTTCK